MSDSQNDRPEPPPPRRQFISSAFIVLVAVWVFGAVLLIVEPAYTRWLVFPFVLIGFVISLCLHEFGHAAIAYVCGDKTVRDKGYLTLDPLHYTDVQYSILFPLMVMAIGGIGLPGGAVYINGQLLRRRAYGTLVSAGGPLATAIVLAALMLALRSGSATLVNRPALEASLSFLALLELTALVFNLLPCPGLDGWGIVEPWFPGIARAFGRRLAPVGPLILVVALFVVPMLNDLFWSAIFWAGERIGLDIHRAFDGYRLFQFWH